MARNQLSAPAAAIKSLEAGTFTTLLNRLDRGGSLQARRLSTGAVQLYWRYTLNGKTHREPVGIYDASAPPKKLEPTSRGFGLAAAVEKCRELASLHESRIQTGGLRELKAETRRVFVAQKQAEVERATHTLDKLLDLYVDHLRQQGRRSHVDASQIFKRHVVEAFPKVAGLPANDVTTDHVLEIQRRLVEAGKGRTSNKLRSYLRAAYQCAQDVKTTASIPVAFKAFGVTNNPAAQTRRLGQFDRADKRPFSLGEMRTYWSLIADASGLEGAVLRLHVLTGGQRIEQLVRLLVKDVRDDAITLYDAKGRPGQGPRLHVVPLVEAARVAVAGLPREGEFAISTTKGAKPISVRTMAGWAQGLVGTRIAGFQLKRVRSGVETLLASKGISRDVRGQLQSHGLTGVQARHYDGHDYLAEKRHALELLVAELRG